jgi:protoporphyrinogen oxidase
MKPVAVIGAGIAGLTAAAELSRQGVPVIVFEAGKVIAGLASSFKDPEGFSYDFGAHFVTNRLAAALGAGDVCRTVRYYGETVFTSGKMYPYPVGLMTSPRFALSAFAAQLKSPAVHSAEDWFRHKFGNALAEEIAMPLAHKWSGAEASDLSPAVGAKLGPGIAYSLYLRLAARITKRAVSNGYSHEMPESPNVFHVYPEGGVVKLLEPLARQLGHLVQLESPVEKILVDGGAVEAVRVRGREIPVSAAISTAPVHILPKLLSGTHALDHMAAFRYRPMIFLNLRFEGRGLLPDTMVWIPDGSMPFFRLTETPISMPWLAPEGKTLITFDIGCEVGDELWTMPEDRLESICLDGLNEVIPNVRKKYLGGCRVLRTQIAYPVFLSRYEEDRLRFGESTGVNGLYSLGRNGEFAHILMEDVYWRTLRRTRSIANYVSQLSLAMPATARQG